jgi:hypothetical protein
MWGLNWSSSCKDNYCACLNFVKAQLKMLIDYVSTPLFCRALPRLNYARNVFPLICHSREGGNPEVETFNKEIS